MILAICLVLAGLFVLLRVVSVLRGDRADINDSNPYLHPEKKDVLPEAQRPFVSPEPKAPKQTGLYDRVWKRLIDALASFFGLVILSPLYLALALAVFIDDPGPILFSQNRIGKGKTYFRLHKFRSMKMSTPHDMPTHLLENPEQYITRVGRFLRRSSLDELPQIWDIFRGKMSIIGPRPALWNQADLIAERDRYGANDIRPGLTGWAQIHGRDELEIPEKARLDGEYVEKESLGLDTRCFFMTIRSVVKSDGVVEGGTGAKPVQVRWPNDGETLFVEDAYQIPKPDQKPKDS